MSAPIRIGENVVIGGGQPWSLIAGPCVIESEAHCLMLAERLREMTAAAGVGFIFKASFDKANRSSARSFRGPGLKEGLRILESVRQRFNVPVLTDVHESGQVAAVAEVCDVVQIPAFLCRQTDLLVAAGAHARCVNIKKGQFLSAPEMRHAVAKVASGGPAPVLLTERGNCFGYNNLVVDFRNLGRLRDLGCPVVFDATHSVQLPAAQGESSGGEPAFIPGLARAALACGVDALFFEVHEAPERALSDGANALPLHRLPRLLQELRQLGELCRNLDSAGAVQG